MATEPYNLNLRHLRALLAIGELGSITAAAELVNLSQPALTQGLSKLEKQFGYTLFERRSAGLIATPMGELVIARTKAALNHLSEAAKDLSAVFMHPERLMTMTQLRAFLALAEAGSFAGAANGTGLSQTSVHRAVGDLEHMIGGKLVERRGRVVWLNSAGKNLARGARLAFSELSAAIADLGITRSGGNELISFGALPLARPFLVPAAMGEMARIEPRASFKVLEGSWRELVEPLRDGAIDMIVGAIRPYEIADLYQMPLFEDRLVIVAGNRHPLRDEAKPTLEQLRAFPWILPPRNTPLRETWNQLFEGQDLPATPIECGSVMIIGRLLTEGNFLTLLSPDQVALQIRSGLLTRIGQPLENSSRRVGITTRRSWRPTAVQYRFLELLKQKAREVETGAEEPHRRRTEWA
jgi:DNA-binding transcriptional LysR family regulator